MNLNITRTKKHIFLNNKHKNSSNIAYFLILETEKELNGKDVIFCGKCQLCTSKHNLINLISRNL